MVAPNEPITLKEVQLRLGAAQHTLIHLCEKGVVRPDFADTTGRGRRREFSQRNLLEFGVALALRRIELSVATSAVIVRVLGGFDRATARALAGFSLTGFVLQRGVRVVLHLYDGSLLVLDAKGGGLRRRLLLAARIDEAQTPLFGHPRVDRVEKLPKQYDAHVEIDVSRIAARVFLGRTGGARRASGVTP